MGSYLTEVAGCDRLALGEWCGAWALWQVLRIDALDGSHVLLAVVCGGALLLAQRHLRALRMLRRVESELARHEGECQRAQERKQAEREREKLRCLGEATSDLIVTSDLQGTLTYLNAGGRRLLGLAADQDVSSLPFESLLAPEVRSRYRDTALPAARRDGRWTGDLQLCGPANTRIDVHCFTFLIRDEETGEPWCFGNICRDVTESRNAERVLRDREELLKTATDAADLGIWELDLASDTTPKRTIRHDQMFGYDELQSTWGRAIAERHVLDEDKPRFREAFERAMESGILSFEVRVRWPDGTVHWIAPLGRVYYDDQGGAVRMAGVVADITERKRTEEQLREADRRKDEFLAILAHELRNPLAPIRNGLQLLRLRQLDATATQRTYAMMERQADHIIRLVDDLLEITRITRGQIELRKSYLDAATVVHRTVETSRPKLDAAGHELVLELPSQPLTLHADPVRLTQVLTNLLVNAARYTKKGGRIVVSAWAEGEEAVLSVCDNGVGISAEVLPHVFELFEQGDRSYNREQGGLGIGLMLVRRLVELHGGTVEARSDGPGCGSEFRVRLPLAAERLEAAPAGLPVAEPDTLAGSRILVADDNHDVAESLAMLLEAMGADVCTVHDGTAALARLDTFQPTIVILDIGMPGMDGYEVARLVRHHPAGRGVTMISLSGWGQETDRRRSRAAGFDHHLVKPVSLRMLLAALHSAPPSADRMVSTS